METVTFLFTDIEGSTALLQRLGHEAYAEILDGHHALIRSSLTAFGGTEVDTQGDAFFAVFGSPQACSAAVLDIQRELEAHEWPVSARVRVRIGVHTGEAARTPTGWVGLDVHRAARIAAVASGGQVVLSQATAAIVKDALPDGAVLTDLGMHRLKDLGRAERLFQLTGPGLIADFPPLRSLGNPALLNNLPAELTPFIGRERELAELRSLVASSRLVTIVGPGGAGKTRLGLHVAAELLDGSGDGVWLVELAPVANEDAVPAAICEALRIAVQPGRSVLNVLLDALALQDILIVLDNCEHLIDSCAKIADAILRGCPRVNLIATSREPLRIDGESIYRVPSLALPAPDESGLLESYDSVALFAARARAHGVVLQSDDHAGSLVVSICRRLDGLPLAIELAAARLRSMSLVELNSRLDQRFRLLTGGSRTAMERQQTLRAAIGWSYSLLTDAEQTVLRRLPVFVDGFDLPAGEAVCGFGAVDPLDVPDLLGSLVDKSLVVAEQSGPAVRYRLLETIREYAAEMLSEAGDKQEESAARAAHCAYYLSLAETAALQLVGHEQVAWLVTMDAEHPNMMAAAEYAATTADGTALVLRFGVALERHWWLHPRYQEAGSRLLSWALDMPDAAGDRRLLCAAMVAAADSTANVDVARALAQAEQAVQLARELDDDQLVVRSLIVQCDIQAGAGNRAIAKPFGEEAVERARTLADDWLLALSLGVYLKASVPTDLQITDRLFAEAVACAHRSGDQLLLSILHNLASYRAATAGDLSRGEAHLHEAIRLSQAFGDLPAHLKINLGLMLHQRGDSDSAQPHLEEGVRAARRNGDHQRLAYGILGLACVASAQANWVRAARLQAAADCLLERMGASWNDWATRYRRESLDNVRANLGQEQSDQASAEGRALSLEQTIDLALASGSEVNAIATARV